MFGSTNSVHLSASNTAYAITTGLYSTSFPRILNSHAISSRALIISAHFPPSTFNFPLIKARILASFDSTVSPAKSALYGYSLSCGIAGRPSVHRSLIRSTLFNSIFSLHSAKSLTLNISGLTPTLALGSWLLAVSSSLIHSVMLGQSISLSRISSIPESFSSIPACR